MRLVAAKTRIHEEDLSRSIDFKALYSFFHLITKDLIGDVGALLMLLVV